jgi:hypothetical protein
MAIWLKKGKRILSYYPAGRKAGEVRVTLPDFLKNEQEAREYENLILAARDFSRLKKRNKRKIKPKDNKKNKAQGILF